METIEEIRYIDDKIRVDCWVMDGKFYVDINDIISAINECQPEVTVAGILDFLKYIINEQAQAKD
ncbi:MAG: hypothetical protein KAS32_07730 [Candidatus Peribacteraceae bacterium]|nr:hypothetical protein [Candidatus Peribacteraceae bacterium]